MNRFALVFASYLAACLATSMPAVAQVNLEANTPAAQNLRASLKQRHQELLPYLESGAVGIGRDGQMALRDANLIPLSQRQKVSGLLAAQSEDWNALYREISRANGHPEWQAEVNNTFAQRRLQKAQAGWWVEGPSGWEKR